MAKNIMVKNIMAKNTMTTNYSIYIILFIILAVVWFLKNRYNEKLEGLTKEFAFVFLFIVELTSILLYIIYIIIYFDFFNSSICF